MAGSRATMAVFFLAVDLAAVIAHPRAVGGGLLAGLAVVLVAGAVAGGWLATRVDDARLRAALVPIVGLSALAALAHVLS
jgi:hypothetical protein